MDRHVRWFARYIIAGVLKRVTIEAALVALAVLAISIVSGAPRSISFLIALALIPAFVFARLAVGCLANPLTSSYLASWPRPTGKVIPTEQANAGSDIDESLKSLGFSAAVSIDEWDGATTALYTRESNQIVAMTSGDDDLIMLSGLTDGRFAATTTQLVPPHEKLVVNRQAGADTKTAASSHVELLRRLTSQGHQVRLLTIDHVMEFLGIEWDAWDQIGPFVGPFVDVGSTPRHTLLSVQVPADEILERTAAPNPDAETPLVGAKPRPTPEPAPQPVAAPPVAAAPQPVAAPPQPLAAPPVPAPQPVAAPQPVPAPQPVAAPPPALRRRAMPAVPQFPPALTPPPIPASPPPIPTERAA